MSTQDTTSHSDSSFLPDALPAVGNTSLIEDYRPGHGDRPALDPASYAAYVPEALDFPYSSYHLRHSVMTLPEYASQFVSSEPLVARRRLRLKPSFKRSALNQNERNHDGSNVLPSSEDLIAWRTLLDRGSPAFERLADAAQRSARQLQPNLREVAPPGLKEEWQQFVGVMSEEDPTARPADPGKRIFELFQDLERRAHSVHADLLIREFLSLERDELIEWRERARSAMPVLRSEVPRLPSERVAEAQRITARLTGIYSAAGMDLPVELTRFAGAVRDGSSATYSQLLLTLFQRVNRDARANRLLEQQFTLLGATNLTLFLEVASLQQEKKQVVDQAVEMIEQLYAHLPYKRARYAIDPGQRLRLLRRRLDVASPAEDEGGTESGPPLTEAAFHEEMFEIFKSLRDPHTFYQLPPVYDDHKAFVPFQLASYGEPGSRRFVITEVAEWFCGSHSHFRPGAEVTHWNGLPIEEAVMSNGQREGGNSYAARFARGLLKMTVRSLRHGLPPREEWVHLRYLQENDGKPFEIIVPWLIWTLRGVSIFDTLADLERSLQARTAPGALQAPDGGSATVDDAMNLSFCPDVVDTYRSSLSGAKQRRTEAVTRLRNNVPGYSYGPATVLSGVEQDQAKEIEFDADSESLLPEIFEFRFLGGRNPPPDATSAAREAPGGDSTGSSIGYVRIRTFSHKHDEFFGEFRRILRLMETHAPDGLIIDVRGNGGGIIRNGERILQLLSPRRIVPEKFYFPSTALTRKVSEKLSAKDGEQAAGTDRAQRTIDRSTRAAVLQTVVSGETQAPSGQFITSEEQANDIGQEYHGPVVLIIDALSYSTTDMFAAGFQDHEIGPIIGVDANTGGGGANVWNFESDVLPILGSLTDIQPVADGTRLGVSVRRCYRSGKNAGLAIEDVGVRADRIHRLTREDLVPSAGGGHCDESGKYRDLLAVAMDQLAKADRVRLTLDPPNWGALRDGLTHTLSVSYQVKNIDRLEFYLNGIPQRTVTIPAHPDTTNGDPAGTRTSLEVPTEGIDWNSEDTVVLEVRGYRGRAVEPVAAVRRSG